MKGGLALLAIVGLAAAWRAMSGQGETIHALPGSVAAVKAPRVPASSPAPLFDGSPYKPDGTIIDWTLPAGVTPAPGAPGSKENPYFGDIYGGDTFVIGGQPSAGDIKAGLYDSTPNTGVTYYTGVDYGSPEAADAALAAYYKNFK